MQIKESKILMQQKQIKSSITHTPPIHNENKILTQIAPSWASNVQVRAGKLGVPQSAPSWASNVQV